ncbi:MAG TPA: hypothetical protein ENJ71_04385, partial [Epsilonproteobacteria bacterium]|nr:hypothetical protein [Campylobacterota bacterium]
MMFSKLIFISTLGLYAGSVLFAENVKGPIIRHEQLNPGLDRQVNIVPMRKYKSEVTYTVTTLPRHGTLYYDGVKIEDPGFTLNDPNKVTIDPEDGNITAVFSYTSTDSAGNVSAPRNIIMRFLDIQISGSVFHDYDGNGIVDGDRISNLNGEPLYVTLVNKENRILSSKLVSKKGRYRFDNSDGLQPNTNYAIIISTQKNVFSSILPEKWSYSGENINSLGRGKDGHKDGIIVVKVREKDIADIDFGLDIRPVAENKKQPTQLNPGGETQVVVPVLEGSDAENGEKVRFYISELPKNATLYNNGKEVSKAGIEIKDPDRLTLDPDDGDQSVVFHYVTADKIGVLSYPAIVEMSFSGLTISGQVLNDGNKNEIVDGQPISALDDSKLYVTLLNDRNIVLGSVETDAEGRYRFDGTQGVVPESDYRVVLSTEPNAKRSHLPKVWNASSEGIMGKNLKSDSLKDGSVAVHVGKKDVSDVDFGVNKKPEAETLRVEPQLNPGGEARVGVPV